MSTGAAGENSPTTEPQSISEGFLWKIQAWSQVFISEIRYLGLFLPGSCLSEGTPLSTMRRRDTSCLTDWTWRQFFLCLFHLKALCCPDNVIDSSQCRLTAARHRHPHALSLPPLITWPLPRRHHPPARLPLFAAGFLMAARRPPAAQAHGAPFMESPFCSRLDSPGRRWPLTPVTSHCQLSESWSALSWIRRYHHTTTDPIKNKFVMLTFNVTFLILWNPKI